MIKKIKCIFLVFICLFFVNVSGVKAVPIKDYHFNFDDADFIEFLNDTIVDSETGISYTNEELLNIIIDNFKDNYKMAIILKKHYGSAGYVYMDVDITQFFYNVSQLKMFYYDDNVQHYWFKPDRNLLGASLGHGASRVMPSVKNTWAVPSGSSAENFTLTSFIQKIQVLINDERDHVYGFITPPDSFPYFSNVDFVFDEEDTLNIKRNDVYYTIAKGDLMSKIFYIENTKSNFSFPVPSFEFSNVQTNENNIITSVDVTFDFKKIPDENTTYMYSLNNGFSWNNLNNDVFTYTTTITSNDTLRAKLLISDSYFNERHIKVDFIGKDIDYYYKWLENKYNREFDEEINSISLSAGSSVEDYLSYWYLQLKRTFPIIFQLSDIMNLFNSDKYNYNSNEVPDTTIDLSFLGIDKSVSIFNFDFYVQYKEQIFNIIKILASIYTFIAVQNIVREASKQT